MHLLMDIEKHQRILLIDNVEKIIKSFESKFRSLTIEKSDINLTGGMNQKEVFQKFYPCMKLL